MGKRFSEKGYVNRLGIISHTVIAVVLYNRVAKGCKDIWLLPDFFRSLSGTCVFGMGVVQKG